MPSPKTDKVMRDAIMVAIKRNVAKGSRTKYCQLIATRLVEAAAEGESWAVKEVCDRIDGKSIQPIAADTRTEIVYRVELIDLTGEEPRETLINGVS